MKWESLSFNIDTEKIKELKERIKRLNINLEDIQEKFIFGSGKGGQKINKTANCVLLNYPKLKLVVKMQRERQRNKNRFLALRELADKIEIIVSPQTSQKLKEWKKIKKQKKRRRKRALLVFALIFAYICFAASPAFCGSWESWGTYEKFILHPEITLDKIIELEEKINNARGEYDRNKYIKELNSFNNRMVFWQGKLLYTIKILDKYLLILQDNFDRIIPAIAIKKLPFDRNGYTIGVKARVIINNNSFFYLDLWSHLPVKPPDSFNYSDFIDKLGLTEAFTYKDKEITNQFYPFLCWWIHFYNPSLSEDQIKTISQCIIYYCDYYNVDITWAVPLFSVESAFIVDAVSPSGAIGIGQLMPPTAKSLGVNPYDVEENIKGTLDYLSQHLKKWSYHKDKISKSLASYNAGPGSVYYYGGVPPYSETRNYIYFIKFIRSRFIDSL